MAALCYPRFAPIAVRRPPNLAGPIGQRARLAEMETYCEEDSSSGFFDRDNGVLFDAQLLLACACGYSVFHVGTSSLFPAGAGGTAWLEYDYSPQYLNWHATQIASANNNKDKRISTNFYSLGVQYMFTHNWGVMAQAPFVDRHFKTTLDDGSTANFTHQAVGDIRI